TDYNYPAFAEAAKKLRARGYTVISPHEVDPGNQPGSRHYLWYVRQTLKQLLECQGVAVLEGVHISSGALRECTLAYDLKMPIMGVDAWCEIDPHDIVNMQIPSWDNGRPV